MLKVSLVNFPIGLQRSKLFENSLLESRKLPRYQSGPLARYFDGWEDPNRFEFRTFGTLKEEDKTVSVVQVIS